MSLDDWEDPFYEKSIDERARAFARRQCVEKPADKAFLLDYIRPGLPEPVEVGGHG